MIATFRSLATAAALISLAAPLAAQPAASPAPVTLGAWIARDQEVGRLAPSPERTAALDGLQRDVVAALRAARAAVDAQTAASATAGQPAGTTCLPPPGTVEITSGEIGSWIYTRPPSEYGDGLEQVMIRFLAYRFPCR
ncbi:hypothetical protein [Erythrobacter sp. CCH5-A1]|uniref:hypothetical protein n=1 Tax=Erythrobacter sp. CCH5-A1 TaxID=1768792 RepID=UPI000A8AC195|nr:hypothetical protein [Erythrobacter sp. CCH5-A1]